MTDVMRVHRKFARLVEKMKAHDLENIKISRGIEPIISDADITRKIADMLEEAEENSRLGIFG